MEELEMMRMQLDALKQQLDTQQIINKDLLRKIMRRKASWLNRLVNIETITLPFIYLMFVGMSAAYGISQWYAFAFLVLGAADTAFDWRAIRIPPDMFGTASILDLKKFLLRQKKMRFIQTCVAAPLAIIWMIAFFTQLLTQSFLTLPTELCGDVKLTATIISLVATAVGVIAIIVLYHMLQRTNDDLLRDIRDLENEN